jgi:A/G-specific adenine glycosylase
VSKADYVAAVVSRQSVNGPEYFLVQRPETGLLAGLWDFPNTALEDPEIEESEAEDVLLEYLGSLGLMNLGKLVKRGSSLHVFTHIRRTSYVYTAQVVSSETPTLSGKWITEDEIKDMAVSELGRKVFRLALGVEKRKLSDEVGKVRMKARKVLKSEKGQMKLSFAIPDKDGH